MCARLRTLGLPFHSRGGERERSEDSLIFTLVKCMNNELSLKNEIVFELSSLLLHTQHVFRSEQVKDSHVDMRVARNQSPCGSHEGRT